MKRLLVPIAALVIARPRRVLGVTTLVCLLLGAAAATAPLDMSFLSVVHEEEPLVARYLAMNEAVRLSHRSLLLLEGPEEELDAAADVAEAVLTAHAEIEWAAIDPRRVNGARLVVASLHADPMTLPAGDIARGQAAFSRVDRAVGEALVGSPVTSSWAGVPAMTIQDIEASLRRFTRLSPLSLLLVLLLLRLVEPTTLRVLLIGVPMALAVVATLGLSALIFGSLTFNEGFFGVVVCGLGADFALHLLVRLREERASGQTFEEALRETLQGAGPAIVAGAVTTLGAFSILALAPETMPRRMGFAGAVGLAFCLGLMLLWLPAAWVLLQRRSPTERRPALAVPGLGGLASWSTARPALVLSVAAVLLLGALAGVPRIRYETDFTRIANRDVDAHETSARIAALFGANAAPWIVASDTLGEARAVHAAFEADPHFVRVEGVATGLPPGLTDVPAETPAAVAAQLKARDGRWLTWASTGYTGLDIRRLAADRVRAEAIAPDVAGYGMFVESIVGPKRPWAPWIGLGILAFVVGVLAVDLRSPRWMVVAICPAAVGLVITLGLLAWADVGFGIVHVLSIPLLLGLGVDDGLHVVHRLREAPGLAVDEAAVSVGRAIVVTTLTTCAGFGALLLSNNPSLESMALVVLIGLPICLLASVTLVPALAVLLRLRSPGAGQAGSRL